MRPVQVISSLTAMVVAGALATAVDADAAASGCAVAYEVGSQWSGGFTASVKVTNLGDPVAGWALTWSYTGGQRVGQAWNATTTQNGGDVTARNATWNGALGTGGSVTFGFNASWNNAANPAPTSFAFNGTTCTGGVVPPSPSSPSSSAPTPSSSPANPSTGVLSQVQTPGRVKVVNDAVQYSWPGVYFEGRFRGTGVGLVLNDSASDYDVQVDGATVATLVQPGRITHWVNNLPDGEHSVRLVKRNDTPWATSAFGGLVAAPGGSILAPPAARRRQIEFIGDSLTVGYGNLSTTRTCSGDQLARRTDTDVSYGALAARRLDADYQVNAYSGLGMVRNYNGGSPNTNYRTYYDRALLNVNGDVWQKPATWQPQVVVIHLGTNDFSTAVNSSESWTPDSLAAAYRAAYIAFIGKLRARYGPTTMIVVAGTTLFGDKTRQVVQAVNSQGDARVRHWQLNETGLDLLGCDWHYSAHDDQLIAAQLGTFLGTLPLTW